MRQRIRKEEGEGSKKAIREETRSVNSVSDEADSDRRGPWEVEFSSKDKAASPRKKILKSSRAV